jgi:hypothetical protein
MVLHFEFKLHSAFHAAEVLLQKYSIDFLNDWLSYESELKYLMFFGESSSSLSSSRGGETDPDILPDFPPALENTICLLRHNPILTNDEKRFILALYIEDAYVVVAAPAAAPFAMLHLVLKSDFVKQDHPTANILQFLCNHIYNQTQFGILKHGLVPPLSEADKAAFAWQDEPGWSQSFLERNPGRTDALHMTHFTYRHTQPPPQQPLYISNYNLACYELSKHIDEIHNDLERYKKSIKYLKKKQKELRKEKHGLYNLYRDHYLAMVTNDDKKWHFL